VPRRHHGQQPEQQFGQWIDHGSPEALLHASVFFDFFPLAGDVTLAFDLYAWLNRAGRNSRCPHSHSQLLPAVLAVDRAGSRQTPPVQPARGGMLKSPHRHGFSLTDRRQTG